MMVRAERLDDPSSVARDASVRRRRRKYRLLSVAGTDGAGVD